MFGCGMLHEHIEGDEEEILAYGVWGWRRRRRVFEKYFVSNILVCEFMNNNAC
jgi:hypothetical protein